MALYNQLGVIVGGVVAAFWSAAVFVWTTLGLLALALSATLGFVREPDSRSLPTQPLWRQLRGLLRLGPGYRNFWVVFWTRFMVLVGLYVLEQYLLYYLQFVLGIRSPQTDVFIILMILSGTALVSSLGAGYLSDRIGDRRRIVAFSGVLQGLCALLFVFSHSLDTVFWAAAVFGLGYGAYQSADWALIVDVLPGASAARDMGIWSISTTGPQLTGLVFGWLLAVLVIPHLGVSAAYRMLFALTAVFFVVGSLLVWRVRRSPSPQAAPEAPASLLHD
jgi:MFS family permease